MPTSRRFESTHPHHGALRLAPGPGVEIAALSAARLTRARCAYSTRRVPLAAAETLISGAVAPRPGDLVLARVEKLRQHRRLELPDGRRAELFPGDEIVVCYANRYAPDQFEAEVPGDLGECHLVAGGGVASRMLSRHEVMKPATEIRPLGLLGDRQGRPLNVFGWALPPGTPPARKPATVAVTGSSMNAGKTTACAYLIQGLKRAGLVVGAAKVTGTGSGGDTWLMRDAGADVVLDFVDAGYASTYRLAADSVERIVRDLTADLARAGAEAIVLEVADGLYQDETAALVASATFADAVDAVLFAAGDAMGAAAGVDWLRRRDLPVAGVTGCLTRSPLACREAAQATGLTVYDLDRLADPQSALDLTHATPRHAAEAQAR